MKVYDKNETYLELGMLSIECLVKLKNAYLSEIKGFLN